MKLNWNTLLVEWNKLASSTWKQERNSIVTYMTDILLCPTHPVLPHTSRRSLGSRMLWVAVLSCQPDKSCSHWMECLQDSYTNSPPVNLHLWRLTTSSRTYRARESAAIMASSRSCSRMRTEKNHRIPALLCCILFTSHVTFPWTPLQICLWKLSRYSWHFLKWHSKCQLPVPARVFREVFYTRYWRPAIDVLTCSSELFVTLFRPSGPTFLFRKDGSKCEWIY